MEWLSQNWIWLALIVGLIWLNRRGGVMGGCCGGHDMAREGPAGEGKTEKTGQAAERSPASHQGGRGGCH